MDLKELFGNQLRELRKSASDQELIQAIDKELDERFETLDFMFNQLNK